MDAKIKVLALISIVVVAAVGAALLIALPSSVKAQTNTPTASVASNVQPTPSPINATNNNGFMFMNGNKGFGVPRGRGGCFGGPGRFGGTFFNGTAGGFGSIQVSSAFTQNVTNILSSSSDVQALLNQGYNVTSIRPVITTSINGNGDVVMQATSANVFLQGPNGRAFVVVDLTTAKVTKIVTTTINNNPS
jgi:hypothetical protein